MSEPVPPHRGSQRGFGVGMGEEGRGMEGGDVWGLGSIQGPLWFGIFTPV